MAVEVQTTPYVKEVVFGEDVQYTCDMSGFLQPGEIVLTPVVTAVEFPSFKDASSILIGPVVLVSTTSVKQRFSNFVRGTQYLVYWKFATYSQVELSPITLLKCEV